MMSNANTDNMAQSSDLEGGMRQLLILRASLDCVFLLVYPHSIAVLACYCETGRSHSEAGGHSKAD